MPVHESSLSEIPDTFQQALVPKRKGGFQPGHKRFGGRAVGSKNRKTTTARAICDRLKCDPVEFLLRAAKTGVLKSGNDTTMELTPADRIQAARSILPYLHSKRSTIHVAASVETETRHVVDVTHIMRNPVLAQAAEELQLQLLESGAITVEPTES